MNNITVIGIGKLGLGFALILESVGYNVLGIDINNEYVESLNSKKYTSNEPLYNDLLINSKNFLASTNLADGINHSEIIFILVQTPNSGGEKFYDHSILSNLLCKINKLRPTDKDIIIGCTVMPGYIDEIGIQLLLDCNNCNLSYNPEFVAQGDIINGFKNPDIVLLGTTNEELKPKIEEVYNKICNSKPKYCFMKPIESEITKISSNGFITTKITYANMISDLCDNLNANKDIVLKAIGSDSRIGNKYFKAGYSYGGPCFPRDTKALKNILDKNNIYSELVNSTNLSNEWHLKYQAEKLLKENRDIYVFENVCYKDNCKIPIIEESAKIKLAKLLKQYGKTIVIRDIEDIIVEVKKEYGSIFKYEIVDHE